MDNFLCFERGWFLQTSPKCLLHRIKANILCLTDKKGRVFRIYCLMNFRIGFRNESCSKRDDVTWLASKYLGAIFTFPTWTRFTGREAEMGWKCDGFIAFLPSTGLDNFRYVSRRVSVIVGFIANITWSLQSIIASQNNLWCPLHCWCPKHVLILFNG